MLSLMRLCVSELTVNMMHGLNILLRSHLREVVHPLISRYDRSQALPMLGVEGKKLSQEGLKLRRDQSSAILLSYNLCIRKVLLLEFREWMAQIKE